MGKKELRKEKMLKRLRMPTSVARIKSDIIRKKLYELEEFAKAKTVFIYISAKNEVDTKVIIKDILTSGTKVILVPATMVKNRSMLASELSDFKDLEVGNFNIMEPRKTSLKEVSPDSIDVSIIPGLAFDKNGNRIGYGHGYYDKFLESIKTPIIALAYDFQLTDDLISEWHDIKVDKIITEKGVIECKRI